MTDMRDADARSRVLGRVREALGARPAAEPEYAGIVRRYRETASLDQQALIELFLDRLLHYQVAVRRCDPAALPEALAGIAVARGRTRLLIPAGLPREWLGPPIEPVVDTGLSYADLDGSEGVLTGCSAAIAETGTIVLRHGPAEGRRALTLLPDYHLCVVFADQIVQTVPEAIRSIGQSRPGLVTTISGPSATADIEMTRIRGVHGPRTLEVVVVT